MICQRRDQSGPIEAVRPRRMFGPFEKRSRDPVISINRRQGRGDVDGPVETTQAGHRVRPEDDRRIIIMEKRGSDVELRRKRPSDVEPSP